MRCDVFGPHSRSRFLVRRLAFEPAGSSRVFDDPMIAFVGGLESRLRSGSDVEGCSRAVAPASFSRFARIGASLESVAIH